MAAGERLDDHPSRAQVVDYLLIVTLIVLIAIVVLVAFTTQLADILAWVAQEIHSE